jgi:fumarate hydratase class II
MHIAVVDILESTLFPAIAVLRTTLAAKAAQFDSVVKVGRTHLQDATPITVGGYCQLSLRQTSQFTLNSLFVSPIPTLILALTLSLDPMCYYR